MKARINLIFLLLFYFTFWGCQQAELEDVFDNVEPETTEANSRSANVALCHVTGQGQFIYLTVNQNAVAAHLAHGDYLLDVDEDGYTAIGACFGTANDCDDLEATTYPGAPEICGDGVDNNCDGQTDEGCITCPCFTEADLQSAYDEGGWEDVWISYEFTASGINQILFRDVTDNFVTSYQFSTWANSGTPFCDQIDSRDNDPNEFSFESQAEHEACKALIQAFSEEVLGCSPVSGTFIICPYN